MKTMYDFEKIQVNQASSVEINSELFRRKIQLKTYQDSLDVENLQVYIDELNTRRIELKILESLQETKEKPSSSKFLLIVSTFLLVIFGVGSIYSKSYLLAIVAIIDFIIAVVSLLNVIDMKREENEK